jgi:hypothetical protein
MQTHVELFEDWKNPFKKNKDERWGIDTYVEVPTLSTPYKGHAYDETDIQNYLNSKTLKDDEYIWTYKVGQTIFYQIVKKSEFMKRVIENAKDLKEVKEALVKFIQNEMDKKGQFGIRPTVRTNFKR